VFLSHNNVVLSRIILLAHVAFVFLRRVLKEFDIEMFKYLSKTEVVYELFSLCLLIYL
jgi:hypothetical protein